MKKFPQSIAWSLATKDHLILKCPFGVFKSPKKLEKVSLLTYSTKNQGNFCQDLVWRNEKKELKIRQLRSLRHDLFGNEPVDVDVHGSLLRI